jgi:hypothetical protein
MISDFSGIIYDYVFLRDKPVMYVKQQFDLRPYDADDLGDNAVHELWQFKTLEQIGVELKEEFFEHIGDSIKNVSGNPLLQDARRKARESAWQYPGEAGKRTADFMLQTAGKN